MADEWENLERGVYSTLNNTKLISQLITHEEVVYVAAASAGCDKHVPLTQDLFELVQSIPDLWLLHHL